MINAGFEIGVTVQQRELYISGVTF